MPVRSLEWRSLLDTEAGTVSSMSVPQAQQSTCPPAAPPPHVQGIAERSVNAVWKAWQQRCKGTTERQAAQSMTLRPRLERDRQASVLTRQ